MAYTIKNADGTVLTTLVDGTVDTQSTSITLIGRNKDAYGQALNTNLVNIMQNFASSVQPRTPLVGQLWFNTNDGRLNVYTLDGVFKVVAGSIMANTKPTTLGPGDLWIDTTNDQLYFTKDGTNTVLAGPIYSAQTGKAGWVVESFTDTNDEVRSVTSLYHDNQLVGILSTASFIIAPGQSSQGMDYITLGLTLNQTYPGIRFAGTSTNADAILGFQAEDYLLKNNQNQNQFVIGTGGMYFRSDSGINIGQYDDMSLFAGGNPGSRSMAFRCNIVDGKMRFVTIQSVPGGSDANYDSLTLVGNKVGVNNINPGANFDVAGDSILRGDVRIEGGLIVVGTQTIVTTQLLQVQDKNIELASSGTWYTDGLVDGGGITLHGTTDKTFTYDNSFTSWTSNLNLNVAGTGTYKVAGTQVLSINTLGPSVQTSYLTALGVLSQLTVSNVVIRGNAVIGTTSSVRISSIASSATTVGSVITVNLLNQVPVLVTGTTVTISGIADVTYNRTYAIASVSSATQFTVLSLNTLTTTTPVLGSTPTAAFVDLMLGAGDSQGGIDATGKQVRNVGYSANPRDAATVQYVLDSIATQQSKGIAITLDITSMNNVNQEIADLLERLAPPVNTSGAPYNDEQYDLPINYRARVLCATNNVIVPTPQVTVNKTMTPVSSYPQATRVDVIQAVNINVASVVTTATYTYSVKEFRVLSGSPNYWAWIQDV